MLDFIIQQPIIAALIALAGLGIIFGALLGFAAEKFKIEGDPVIDQIDELVAQCGDSSLSDETNQAKTNSGIASIL